MDGATFFAVMPSWPANHTAAGLGNADVKVLGTSNLHDWSMEDKDVACSVQFTYATGKSLPVALTAFTFTLPVHSLKSGKSGMDSKAYDAMKAKDQSNIVFSASSSTIVPGANNQFVVKCKGNLSIAGVSKAVFLKGSALFHPPFRRGSGACVVLGPRKRLVQGFLAGKGRRIRVFVLVGGGPADDVADLCSISRCSIIDRTTKEASMYLRLQRPIRFQMLRDKNTALPITETGFTGNVNSLERLTNGFDLAMDNLNIDAQLADGIRVNLTTYLASRHPEDTWVKGGYIQFDKLLFLHSRLVDTLMKSFTIKIGQFDVYYGDQHCRRTDGGNTIYNPFVENYIMDEFATELGGEVYYHHPSGLFLMVGVTNGELDPTLGSMARKRST